MSKQKCPVLIDLEKRAYDPPPRFELMKYLNAGKKLMAQGDIAFCDNNHNTAYMCYYGFCKMYLKHIMTHEHAGVQRYADIMTEMRDHAEMAMDRLESLAATIEANYEQQQLGLAPIGSSSGASTAPGGKMGSAPAPGGMGGQNDEDKELSQRLAGLNVGGAGQSASPSSQINPPAPGSTAAAAAAAAGATAGTAGAIGGGAGYDILKPKQYSNSTIGLDTSMTGLSQRLFNQNNQYGDRADYVHQNAEKAYGFAPNRPSAGESGTGNYAKAPINTYLDPSAAPRQPGATLPNTARDRPKQSYLNNILYPKEKAKFAPMKPLHLPTAAIRGFLAEAEEDLQHNVETFALLFGHEYEGEYYVKGMVLPEQEGRTDHVNTKNEERMIQVIQGRNMIALGWIHTHPSEHAFLSSIDLHCHASYQNAIPEAIAIVCAPKHNTNGIFSLSLQGIDALKQCQTSTDRFHEHVQTVPFFDNSQHVVLHYPRGHQKHHEVSDVIIPPPAKGLSRISNWVKNEGLRRYECEIVDLRRGKGNDRGYVFPPRNAKDPGPSGGKGVPRSSYSGDAGSAGKGLDGRDTRGGGSGGNIGGYGGYGPSASSGGGSAFSSQHQQQSYGHHQASHQQHQQNDEFAILTRGMSTPSSGGQSNHQHHQPSPQYSQGYNGDGPNSSNNGNYSQQQQQPQYQQQPQQQYQPPQPQQPPSSGSGPYQSLYPKIK